MQKTRAITLLFFWSCPLLFLFRKKMTICNSNIISFVLKALLLLLFSFFILCCELSVAAHTNIAEVYGATNKNLCCYCSLSHKRTLSLSIILFHTQTYSFFLFVSLSLSLSLSHSHAQFISLSPTHKKY